MIRLSKSCLSPAEKAAVMEVLDREYLGMGTDVQCFESGLETFLSRPVACVGTGTAALQLALQACGIGPGDEVLAPSLTFVATFQAIRATGARPVACDIDPQTLILDAGEIERRATAKTRAIVPVWYGGGVGDCDDIYAAARRCGIRVVEDAAHAFGTTFRGRRVGSFGDVTCFSFDGIKNITSGEGGCVVSDDASVMERVRDARLLGVERDTEKRFSGQRSWAFDVHAQGWRYHMSNIMAAIGKTQLARFPQLSQRRRDLARRYDETFRDDERIRPLMHDYEEVVPHLYVVRLAGLSESRREEVRAAMSRAGIETGAHYFPNHRLAYFRPEPGSAPLPVTESVFPELLSLPLHPDLADTDVELVAQTLRRALDE